jgi:hypothetical protein
VAIPAMIRQAMTESDPSKGKRRADLNRRLRRAFIDGAEDWARRDGKALTADEQSLTV